MSHKPNSLFAGPGEEVDSFSPDTFVPTYCIRCHRPAATIAGIKSAARQSCRRDLVMPSLGYL